MQQVLCASRSCFEFARRCPVRVLVIGSSSRIGRQVDDLQLLFTHIHHLINEFRPHQARETLRVMMDLQRRQRLAIADRFQQHLATVRETLQRTMCELPDVTHFEFELPKSEYQPSDEATRAAAAVATTEDDFSVRDQMMCDIVDTLE